jgi:membrane protease YdiL (CAAX protease family)
MLVVTLLCLLAPLTSIRVKAFKEIQSKLKKGHQMKKYYLFLLFLICGISLPSLSGLLIFPFSMVTSQLMLEYTLILALIFLSLSVFLRSRQSLKSYWPILFAFFIASFALFIDFLVYFPANTPSGFLMDMLLSASVIVSIIVILTKISGNTLGSIFLRKGNLKLGVTVGLIGFFVFAVTAIPVAQLLFNGQNLSLDRVIAWLPWILTIVLLNGVREELLYRGLFLKKYETKLGLKTSNLLQAIIFSLSHSVAGVGLSAYTPFIWALVIFTFALGLAWGYLMQRTDSIIGSVLFHAGTDIPVFIGIFSNIF